VIATFTDASDLLRKIGLRVEVVKSGVKKDVGAYWRAMTPDERAMMDGIINDVYDQFTQAVAEGRRPTAGAGPELADGRILTGRQALEAGLADTLGFRRDAVEMAAALAGLSPDTPVLMKKRFESDWLDLIRRLAGLAHVAGKGQLQLMYR